jgi:hypothetical protein
MKLRIILKNDELLESQSLEVACPSCSSKPHEPCELNTGQQRQSSHLDRRLAAKDLIVAKGKSRAASAGSQG